MKTKKTKVLGAALMALLGMAGTRAQAQTTTSYLNIDVTFSNAVSVTVDAANSSTYTVTWTSANQQLVSPSSATVTNNSIVTERWKLYTDTNSLPMAGGNGDAWTVTASSTGVGADSFAIQAVFGSSNTIGTGCTSVASATTWNITSVAPLLTTTFAAGLQYTSAGQLASPDLTTGGGSSGPDTSLSLGSMYGGDKRALCWRMIAPKSTVSTSNQNVQVIVAAF